MAKVLGIDYGARRVGVALSDDGHTFAFPKTVLANKDNLLQTLADMAAAEGAVSFVVGEGDNPAGGANTIERRIAIFAEALKVRTGLPVVCMNEAYSSAEARRALEERVATRKDKTVPVDAALTCIFKILRTSTHVWCLEF
jgi:putative Holliday junction resolvase